MLQISFDNAKVLEIHLKNEEENLNLYVNFKNSDGFFNHEWQVDGSDVVKILKRFDVIKPYSFSKTINSGITSKPKKRFPLWKYYGNMVMN